MSWRSGGGGEKACTGQVCVRMRVCACVCLPKACVKKKMVRNYIFFLRQQEAKTVAIFVQNLKSHILQVEQETNK